MEIIKTFIFLDLETTGLPQNEKSDTKITEIALVAATRKHILDKHHGAVNENVVLNDFLPRILSKISCPIYPCKMIHPIASEVSGLTNESLEYQKPFDENLFNLMVLFMERLEKPICLVAHNGGRFDFPILRAEVAKIGKELSDDLFCVDSLPGFREVLVNNCKSHQNDTILSGIKPLSISNKPSSLLPKCGWSNDEYDNEMMQATEFAESLTQKSKEFNVEELETQIKLQMERVRKCNESTPVRTRKSIPAEPAKENGAKRKILNDKQEPKKNFNLKSLYESLTKKNLVDAHRAEADALALLECVTAVGRPILEWMDCNRIPFKSIRR